MVDEIDGCGLKNEWKKFQDSQARPSTSSIERENKKQLKKDMQTKDSLSHQQTTTLKTDIDNKLTNN